MEPSPGQRQSLLASGVVRENVTYVENEVELINSAIQAVQVSKAICFTIKTFGYI